MLLAASGSRRPLHGVVANLPSHRVPDTNVSGNSSMINFTRDDEIDPRATHSRLALDDIAVGDDGEAQERAIATRNDMIDEALGSNAGVLYLLAGHEPSVRLACPAREMR
jgi:hypothetical protein